jgi:hypothetical protein
MMVGAFRHLDGGVWSQHVEESLGGGDGSTEIDARAHVVTRFIPGNAHVEGHSI